MRVVFPHLASVVALLCLAGGASASPILWTLNNVSLSDGSTVSGSFVFNADVITPCTSTTSPCGTYSNVNITTTAGTTFLTGATYGFVCGTSDPSCTNTTPDSTQVLFLTSSSASQTGNRAIAFFFTAAGPLPPAGLSDAGGVIDISNGAVGAVNEGTCSDNACDPNATARASISGTVVGTPLPEPTTWALLLAGLFTMTTLHRRFASRG